jgi:hypothetical protein
MLFFKNASTEQRVTLTHSLQIDDSQPLQFSQTFQLIKEGATYWV